MISPSSLRAVTSSGVSRPSSSTIRMATAGGKFGCTAASTASEMAMPSEPVVSGIACPRTPWGSRTIEHIERVLGSATGRQFLRDEFLSHLSVDAKARYGARVDAFYAKPLNVSPR